MLLCNEMKCCYVQLSKDLMTLYCVMPPALNYLSPLIFNTILKYNLLVFADSFLKAIIDKTVLNLYLLKILLLDLFCERFKFLSTYFNSTYY